MVASGLNTNDAKHLNQMLPLGYRTADCQQGVDMESPK